MEILIAVIGLALVLYPMWKITGRSGLNPLWTLLCVIPLGLIVLLWMIALRPWPGEGA
ncbi:MAG: hypothetical protein H0T41_07745 [Rhodobacteraceae bacterium]|nr:hypothetical protein [Paracoccaceae bacterium]